MRNKKKITSLNGFVFLIVAIFLFTSCSLPAEEEDFRSNFQIQLESGKAGLLGKLVNENEEPIEEEVIRLAKVIWSEDKTSASFVIDGANSPSTISEEDGFLVFLNINPGDYVIVVRNIDINPIVIPKSPDSNEAAVFTMISNEILDVGIIKINTGP